ncbi:hypothetical protein QBC33DRAFT_511229 [Phialemonium atrogriseum]|uniref:Uncharacterized protein n=1 Tax=Phialemonium atrogriseum TaxID=1093897 RepID=A0AAJ0C864_9PEZI|nr:uncharacterized protein QBC33DRAFT_511229 [Phialemonium atrogriseum]KAK1771730.1 hypothetical protein QBC33DRAFT_511229 [Phialemonium atrogriseum]
MPLPPCSFPLEVPLAPSSGQRANRRPTLLRSALASQKPRTQSQLDGLRPVALQTPRPVSEHIPRTPEPGPKLEEKPDDGEEEDDNDAEEDQQSKIPMNADPNPLPTSDLSPLPQSPDTASTTSTSRRRRRVPRKTTRYALAYPAPRFAGKSLVVQKVNPKLYLQLQQVSEANRPVPIIDVFPSSRLAGPLVASRVAKRFPRVFGAKGELGAADVVVMQSEAYDINSHALESEDEDDGLDQRKLLAVFSPLKKKSDLTEIVLDDGSAWVAQMLPTGSFDFVHVDAHGITTTARWARRPGMQTNTTWPLGDATPQPTPTTSSDSSGLKYTFSILNPLTRRHPIMATLTQSALDIQSHYTTVTMSSSRYPPSRRRSQTLPSFSRAFPTSPSSRTVASASASDRDSGSETILPPEPESERTSHPVDNATKMLISITAVWLALRSGWSPYYKSPHSQASDHALPPSSSTPGPSVATTPAATTARQSRRCVWPRRDSLDESNMSGPRPIDLPDQYLLGSSRGASGHRPSSLGMAKTMPLQPGIYIRDQSPGPSTSAIPSSAFSMSKPVPRRATSTGAAFMQRHIQLQSPEASDTEHAAAGQGTGNRRNVRGRILSGDWAPAFARFSRPLSFHGRGRDPGSVSPSSQSSPETGPDQANTMPDHPSHTVAPSAGGRRVQSAYYPSNSMRLEDIRDGDGESKVEPGAAPDHVPGATGAGTQEDHCAESRWSEDDDRRGGFAGKLKSFGNWFRRLGTH